MELRELIELILRRRLLIILTAMAVVTSVGFYVFLVTPLYESDCKLLLVESKPVGIGAGTLGADLMFQSLGKSDPVTTQIEIIKTRPILSKVIELAQMKDGRGNPVRVEDLKQQMKVEVVRNTNLISVSYRDRNPQHAAAVINTLARVFAERDQKLNQEELASTKAFLEDQIAARRRSLADAEKGVLDFKRSHKSFSLENEAQAMVDTQVALETSRMQLDTELKGAQAQQAALASKIAAPAAVSDRYYSYWNTTLEQVNGQITGLLAQLRNIDRQLREIRMSLGQLPPKEVEFARLVRNENIASEIYSTLLHQYEEVRVNEAAKIASIRLVEPAVVSDTPAFPEKRRYLLLASLMGLLLGLGVALTFERFDDSPRSIEQVKTLLPYDILGYIPRQKSGSPLSISSDPQSPFSEAFRLVQANLKFKPAAREKCFSIMITSASPGEGKSTLAANLSSTFGVNGTRAAIVNLDLRRPNAFFGRSTDKGLTDYLIGDSALDEIMVTKDGRGLTIIPSGSVPPNPAELVASHKLRELVQHLSESFDVVIYDTAPVTLVAETLELSRHVNGIILVVDISIATRSALKAMNELVSNKGLVILGTILNRVNRKGSDNHYYAAYHGKARRGGAGAHGGSRERTRGPA